MFDGELIHRTKCLTLEDFILNELKENAFLFNIYVRLEDTESNIFIPLHGIHKALRLLGVPFDEKGRVIYTDMIDKYWYELLDNPKEFIAWVRDELAKEEQLDQSGMSEDVEVVF